MTHVMEVQNAPSTTTEVVELSIADLALISGGQREFWLKGGANQTDGAYIEAGIKWTF